MKNFLLYILRSYLWTVIAITLVALFGSLIIDYCNNIEDKTPFSSPVFVALISGIVYPVYNLAVIAIFAVLGYFFDKWWIVLFSLL